MSGPLLPVMSKKYIVALVVKRHYPTALKFWVIVKGCGEHSTDSMT